ncbi:hypothetical protein IV203_028379 [Nitzschia inconspicua]|uniref:Uncharacterized protein n=1 Tax=Nitzschia inconspicua TaxID=303405 RepID=A0A9K3LPS7_9STRA|nr:hypothetical protein IV203_028379 [Nitzschia inconspicua]
MGFTDSSSVNHSSMLNGGYTSGFLGFRTRHHIASSVSNHHNHHQQNYNDQDEALSVVSVATSNNFWGSVNHEQERKKKNSGAVSVMSDLSQISEADVADETMFTHDLTLHGNEFVIQCKRGDMLFVANAQAKIIKARCRHFRLLLSTGRGGHVIIPNASDVQTDKGKENKDKNDTSTGLQDNRILHKETWSIGTARRVIELLTEGTTWIENDHRHFRNLSKACDECDIKLCLGSLINYHDILDQESTFRFFDLISLNNYQFKFQAIISSWQWMHLLHKGILLLPKCKVLMITVAPPSGGTPLLPTSAKATATKISPSLPNQQRLAKCDTLCSEFCVYSTHGSKINALLTILDFLSKSKTNDTDATTTPKTSQRRLTKGIAPEKFQIVYQTRIGSIAQDDLNMLWRLTSASYTLSTPNERQYLPKMELSPSKAVEVPATVATSTNTSHKDGDDQSLTSHEDPSTPPLHPLCKDVSPLPPSPSKIPVTAPIMPALPPSSDRFQFRTLTGTSCMVLRQLFDPLNVEDENLPACILVSNPSPDTLGRFLNAASSAKRKHHFNVATVGWDILVRGSGCNNIKNSSSCNSETIFFVSSTTMEIKDILEYLSDYNSSAIVNGGNEGKEDSVVDYRLQQFVAG